MTAQALKDRLKRLAVEEAGTFHVEVRRRAGKKATAGLERKLRNLIYSMPGFVSCALASWSLHHPDSAARVGDALLRYIEDGRDLLPEAQLGLFGYIDDSYFAASLYEKVLNDPEGLERIRQLRSLVRLVIPEEARAIDGMVERVTRGPVTP